MFEYIHTACKFHQKGHCHKGNACPYNHGNLISFMTLLPSFHFSIHTNMSDLGSPAPKRKKWMEGGEEEEEGEEEEGEEKGEITIK